jgi:hypothetical protein
MTAPGRVDIAMSALYPQQRTLPRRTETVSLSRSCSRRSCCVLSLDLRRRVPKNRVGLEAQDRPHLAATFGRHGGTTEASTSGLTETQLMQKGQWSSTAAMSHYLHDDDEAKQDAQMKRIKRRAKLAKQATVK